MKTAVQQQPAYVLHRRPYRETSLLVEVFSLDAGRMTLVARGANAARSPLKAQLQPFQPLLLDWQGRGDLKTLTQTEVRPGPVLARTQALYSGLYINELLQRLLPVADPQPELFAAYIETLAQLAQTQDLEPVLRRFEAAFADAMGLSFDWAWATDVGEAVAAGGVYGYDPEQGIVSGAAAGVRLQGLPGEVLLALADGDLASPDCRRLAKRVMRTLIDHLLQGRTLNSRALFSQGRGDRR
ncbi:MAG: DNA repair protein RecO [Marinobacter sp.]|uniref:DNA repair protein RecO n=1 Tax=Marinobacter sp. TaxID=50741 RepID=UPI00299D7778|nr:DNA repair protein RecO [Marinobacter sp.]MDX1634053.1 DNA repair protein RecO [Marinobacter sp.]